MTSDASWIWLGLCCLSLIAVGASGLSVSQSRRRHQKIEARVHDVVSHYRDLRRAEPRTLRKTANAKRSPALQAASVFGFEWSHLDHSPLPWWAVLALALFLARMAASFLTDVVGSWGWAAMPAIWVGLSRSYFGWSHGRHNAVLIRQFPDALAMIVRSLGVGVPAQGAIAMVAREGTPPTSLEFARLADELGIGVPLGQAVRSMALRNGLAEYRFFATAVGLQAQTGGGLTETLENLAGLIRKRLALSNRASALSSEARTSALILAGLPVVLGALLWLVNPAYVSQLFTDSMGRRILGVAILLLASGGLVMRVIIKRSLS